MAIGTPKKRSSAVKSASSRKLEGEGSYSATRSYNENLARGVAKGGIPRGAEQARRALEGPQSAGLRRAEAAAKRGPRRTKASARPGRSV